MTGVEKFKNTYSGRRLLEKYTTDTQGLWQVFGEDPNCDMGGYHHEPLLATMEGTLQDVIETAVELPRFWTWGGGGRIEKIEPLKVEAVHERQEKRARMKQLQQELSVLKRELGE